MAEIERVEDGAFGTAGTNEVECIVDSSATEVFGDGEGDGLLVVLRAEGDEREVTEDGLLNDALDIGWLEAGL